MIRWTVRLLTPDTWPDFAAVIDNGGGAWGGCWCLGFHQAPVKNGTVEGSRKAKEGRVHAGTTHASLVYDGARVVGWCQFGSPAELPRIKHGREYASAGLPLPDWRVTCFFVDPAYRRKGVATAALSGALAEIARCGGGRVESYPEDTAGRKVSSSFLYNAPLSLFERLGFSRVRRLGQNHWVVTQTLAAEPAHS